MSSRRAVALGWSCSLSLAVAAVLTASAPPPAPERGRVDGLQRWLFPAERPEKTAPANLVATRRHSAGPVPVAARAEAYRAYADSPEAEAAPGVWQHVGPFNIGGRVTALGVDPNDQTRIWLGSAAGGVWLSDDAGTNWSPVFDEQVSLAIGAIAVHPTDSNTVWVGTGEDNGGGYSYDGDGVYKTTDGGLTWTNVGLSETRRIGRIAVDPIDPQRVFVAAGGNVFGKDAHRGVYRSLDGGATWQQVLFVADDTGAIDIALDPTDPDRILAAVWQRHSFGQDWYVGGVESGIYRSLDGGETWTRLAGGLPSGPNVGRIGVDIAESAPNIAYAIVISDTGNLIGVYRTTDFGDTWVQRDRDPFFRFFFFFSYYFGNIVVDPTDPNTVYVLDVNLWRSSNGAQNFAQIDSGVHPDHHAFAIGPDGRLYDGNDGGFYRSFDNGLTWFHAETLPITQLYDIGIDTLDPNRRFAGAQDNGTNRTTTGGTSDWHNVLGGDGMETEVDWSDSNFVYAESQFGNIARSTDGGDTFSSAQNGIDPSETANWVTPITIDPIDPAIVYTGYERVYRSTDRALNWTPISPVLPGCPAGADHCAESAAGGGDSRPGPNHTENLIRETITVVKVSPVDNAIVWAGTDDGHVWVTPDGGTTWNEVTPPGPEFWVTDIAPDPFDANRAYLTVTGYRQGDRTPFVRVTDDLGATWNDISAGLPAAPANTLAVDPDWPGQVFLGTDVGMYLTDDGGASWQEMNGGMPIMVILDLQLHQPTRTLYLGSHARGIWTFDLGQLPPPDRDGDGVVNVNDCAPDDAGAFGLPGEVVPLDVGEDVAGAALLSWPSLAPDAGPGTVYDLTRATLSALRAAGGTTAGGDFACDLAATSTTDPDLPPAGDGFWYLVRGDNACGAGTWGTDSSGQQRQPAACP